MHNSLYPIYVATLASAAAQEPNCAETGPGLYEYPENCRKYYSCDVTGTLSLELCYDNWLFRLVKMCYELYGIMILINDS